MADGVQPANGPKIKGPTKRNGDVKPGYDVIVIGAGSMGSAAAYHLARDGRRVLLVEQFQVGHTRGSSHGGSRIIRYTHDQVDHARLMPATFALWQQLEEESGERLLQLTGGLYLGAADNAFVAACRTALEALNFPYRLLDHQELGRTYPQFRLPAGWIGLYQEQTGILAASRAVQVMVREAVRHGAELREKTRVQSVTPAGTGVTVHLAGPQGDEVVQAEQAILAAGPWASTFLRTLLDFPIPLRVTHQQVAYFRAGRPEDFAVGRFPVFIVGEDPHFYGFPIFERPGTVKVALEQDVRTVDPDQEGAEDPAMTAELSGLIARHLPGLNAKPELVEICRYTETPNRAFIIDRHPTFPQILIAAGFSGRGFKHAIAVGRLLADLSAAAPGVYDSPFWLDEFRLSRFQASQEAAV